MPDTDDLKDALPGLAVRLDALRTTGLEGLSLVLEARGAGLARERDQLTRKLGPEHPRVHALSLRLEHAAVRRRSLAVEVVRARTPLVRVDAQGWALHGYVRWMDLSPAADVTVSLVDGKGQWLKSFGYACTDERGYFRVEAKLDQATAAAGSISSVHLRVTDGDRKELYRGEDALAVVAGAVEYREIALEGGGRVCEPPEEEGTPVSPPAEAKPVRGGPARRTKARS